MTVDFTHQVTLEQSDDGKIAWLRFDSDHKANVFTIGMLRDLTARVEELRDAEPSEQPNVLVIAGRDTIFSGGADLKSIQEMPDEAYVEYIRTEYHLFQMIDTLPFITIAMLAGPTIGNGSELALACDFRIAAENIRFGLPEMAVGFIAPTQRLARFVGIGKAKEILFSSALLKAPEALDLGLVTQVVPIDDLVAETQKAAERYAAVAPVALRLTKQGMQRAYRYDPEHDDLEQQWAFATFKSDDFQEGADAVLNRRQPQFAGK